MILPRGRDFAWQANATASGLSKPNVHLWNPAAANTNLWVYRIIVSNIATGSTMIGWTLGRKDTILTGSPNYSASFMLLDDYQNEVTSISCTTDTSTTLTAASGFLALRVGMTINGANVTAGTRIASIESDTSLTMTQVGAGAGTQSEIFGGSAARVAATTSAVGADVPATIFRGVCDVNKNSTIDLIQRPIVLLPGDGLVCKSNQPSSGAAGIQSVTYFGREVPV